MFKVYFNYPHSEIVIHKNRSCGHIKKHQKEGQRSRQLNAKTISNEIMNFGTDSYKFDSTSISNDMWLEIDFADAEFEEAVLCYVQRVLGRRYRPFRDVPIQVCCPA